MNLFLDAVMLELGIFSKYTNNEYYLKVVKPNNFSRCKNVGVFNSNIKNTIICIGSYIYFNFIIQKANLCDSPEYSFKISNKSVKIRIYIRI